MSTIHEIIARPKKGEGIRPEFDRFLAMAREKPWDKLEVLFGFAWGSDAYEGNWISEVISPDALQSRVEHLESSEAGVIGGDDLFITVMATGIQYTFCHENDIHLKGRADDPYIKVEAERFRALGWEISQRTLESEGDGNGGSSGTD